MRVLNVGGGDKSIPIPAHYEGWEHVLLDIKARPGVDLACDARLLSRQKAGAFDAVYCSHNLEHYYLHEVPLVLAGFRHVLAPGGFAEIRVPDIAAVIRHAVAKELELDDVLYESPAGPITVHDVLYGYGRQIAESGEDYYAHKRGFTRKSLDAALTEAGFVEVWLRDAAEDFEIAALAFTRPSGAAARALLGLPPL